MQLSIHSYQLIKTGRVGQKHSVRFGPGPNHPSIAKHNFPVPLFAHFACRFAFPFCPSTFTPPPSVRCPSFCLVTEGQWLYGIMFKNYTFVYMYMYIYTVKKQVFGPHSKLPVKKESERSPTGKTFSHSINLENLISCTQFEWRRAINIKRQKAVRIWPNLRREEKASRGHDDGIENGESRILY